MDDESIIELYLKRSEEAVVQTEIKYGRLLTRVAKSILRDSRDAEEAVWDTYTRLWNSIPPQHPKRLMAYAAKLCRNTALGALRKRQTQKRDDRGDVLSSELEACLPWEGDVGARLEERELVLMINTYLLTLDKISRVIFVRRYFMMEDLETIASDLGMSKNAVTVRLHRVRNGLRKHLNKEGVAV